MAFEKTREKANELGHRMKERTSKLRHNIKSKLSKDKTTGQSSAQKASENLMKPKATTTQKKHFYDPLVTKFKSFTGKQKKLAAAPSQSGKPLP